MAANTLYVVVGVAVVAMILLWLNTSQNCRQGYQPERDFNYIANDYLTEVPPSVGNPNFDQDVSAVDFANVLGTVDYTASNVHLNNVGSRYQKLHDSTKLPAATSYLTNYDTDVANPSFYAYSQRAPRVIVKSRVYDNCGDYIRGDLPIKRHPDVALIEKSSYGRESTRFSGTFNPKYDQMIADYVYAQEDNRGKNMPINVSRESTVMDMTQA
jgi:hypothetical protein